MDIKDLMVTIPLSVYTDMVKQLAVKDIEDAKDGEISELTDKMGKEIADLEGEVSYYRNLWYEAHQKLQKIEEERSKEDA